MKVPISRSERSHKSLLGPDGFLGSFSYPPAQVVVQGKVAPVLGPQAGKGASGAGPPLKR